jgi:hypothetical protein
MAASPIEINFSFAEAYWAPFNTAGRDSGNLISFSKKNKGHKPFALQAGY